MNDAYKVLLETGMSSKSAMETLPFTATRNLLAAEAIWRRGDVEQPWTYIVSGLVCASLPGEDGAFNAVNAYGPGSWVGEACLVNGQASALEYVCVNPTVALQVPLERARELLATDIDFCRYIARLAAWRSEHRADQLALMGNGSPPLRVTFGLALLAEALQSGSSPQPRTEAGDTLQLPLKQALLAGMFGVSRGMFSFYVQQLAAIGWVRVNYSLVQLLGLGKWKKFSEALRQSRASMVKPTVDELVSFLLKGQTTTEPHASERRSGYRHAEFPGQGGSGGSGPIG